MHKAQRKPVQGTPVYTAVFAGHSDPRRYSNQYVPYYHINCIIQLRCKALTVPILPAEVNQDPDEDIFTEQVSEVEKILQDLENGVVDEILPQLTEDDVAFDMDEVVVEEEDVLDEDESNTDGEENDIGWIDTEERE